MPLDLLNQNGVGWLKMFLRFEEVRRPQTKEREKTGHVKYAHILPLFVMRPQYPRNSCDFLRKKRSIPPLIVPRHIA